MMSPLIIVIQSFMRIISCRYINVIPSFQQANDPSNWTSVFSHAQRSDNVTVGTMTLRHQPILSMFAMPLPLVCSVVAVVSCSRNDHILVRHHSSNCFVFLAWKG